MDNAGVTVWIGNYLENTCQNKSATPNMGFAILIAD